MSPPETFPALATLLAPFSVAAFLDAHWERAPLHVARGGDASAALLTLAELDAILTTQTHRHPDLSVVSAAREIAVDAYAEADDVVDPARVVKLFSEGSTLILNRLDESSTRVREACVRLEAELGIAVQANVYLTPGGAQGFPTHYDNHDVIIVQCAGRKAWRLFDSPVPLPMRGERFDRATTPTGALSATFETQAGDALYIPRGLMHEAVAVDGDSSLHVTLGLHPVRWSEVLIEAVAEVALDDLELRKALPLGALVGSVPDEALRDKLRAHAARVIDALHWAPVRDRLVTRFAGEHKEALGGMLSSAAAHLDAATRLETRAGLVASVMPDGDAVLLTINGRTTRWPGRAGATLERALKHTRFGLDDLGDELDLAGRVTLVRKLIVEGAVRVVD